MSKGVYPRQKRGSYNKQNIPEGRMLIKRALYLTNDEYWTLTGVAKDKNIPIANLIRLIIDKYIEDNNIELVTVNPEK